jgi:hypothetical protein
VTGNHAPVGLQAFDLLTVFFIPKPFLGHIGVIQRNALGTWMRLGEGVQVILHGNDEGVAEATCEAAPNTRGTLSETNTEPHF